MTKRFVSRSVAKHIRREKARIRKAFHFPTASQAAIDDLYRRIGILESHKSSDLKRQKKREARHIKALNS